MLQNGKIALEQVNGPVKASTENGDIALSHVTGQMTVAVSSGSIQATSISGQLQAIAQHGDVTLRQAMLSDRSLLKTTDGSLRFTGTFDSTGTYTLETLHGNVDLTLPSTTIFQLQARIGSGSVSNEFGTNYRTSLSRPLILVSIGNGSVTIKKGA